MYIKGAMFMPQIRPITDLQNTNEISEICHAQKEPVFITKNGRRDLVVMNMESYNELMDTLAVDAAICDAEEECQQSGQLHDAESVFAELRGRYFG